MTPNQAALRNFRSDICQKNENCGRLTTANTYTARLFHANGFVVYSQKKGYSFMLRLTELMCLL